MTTSHPIREPDWEEAAALLGAERVVLARPTAPDWALAAKRLRPHDQLYRSLLQGVEVPLAGIVEGGVVDTAELGDAGRRMHAAGVARVVVVPGPESGTLLIGENPARNDTAGRGGERRPAALLAPEGNRADRDVLASWVETVARLAPQPLVGPAGAAALAEAAGADLAVLLWPDEDRVTACWAGADSGRQVAEALTWPLPEDPAAVGAALDDLTTSPPVAPWQVVHSGRGTLAVALRPPRPADRSLVLVADLLALDLERSRTTREGRQQSLLEERVRIAGLIHDGVTQQVSNVVIQLQLLELAADEPARLRAAFGDAREATSAALEELRASLYELAPRSPTTEELVPSLREWCRDYTAQWGIHVKLEADGAPRRVDPERNMLAYAAVQECLTNVRKHASASSATVRLSFGPAGLTVEVADNGAGFAEPPGEPTPAGRRMGLRLLRDRIRSAGGTLEVVSRPGDGARVTVRLPE